MQKLHFYLEQQSASFGLLRSVLREHLGHPKLTPNQRETLLVISPQYDVERRDLFLDTVLQWKMLFQLQSNAFGRNGM